MESITSQIAYVKARPFKVGLFAVLATLSVGMALAFATGLTSPDKIMAQVIVQPPCCVVVPPPPVVLPPVVVVPVVPVVQPPCCTESTPPTVTPPVVTPPIVQPPCCTEETPPTVTPPVVTPPVVPPVIDLCPNIDLDQDSLPDGYYVDDNGNCVPRITTDLCPNRPDLDKKNLPEGYYVDGDGNCVTRPTTDIKQCVFLTGNNAGGGIPVVINKGQPFNLEWKTEGVPSVTISNVDGSLPATGSKTVYPTSNTTYVLTAPGINTPCQVSVVITTIDQGPQCLSLTADKATIKKGETVTLKWVISNASFIDITNVGKREGLTGSVEVTPTENTTYSGTVEGAPDSGTACVAEVKIEDDSCTSNCGGGGGGGGGRRSPRVGLESFVPDLEEPLSFVYLSEVPYTGLELGTWGTVLYWMMLIGWSLALAYLVLFNAVPFALSRVKSFGGNVKEALNNDAHGADSHGHDAHAAPVAHASHAPAHHGHAPAHAPAAPAKPTGYNTHDGFRSFAAGEGLTIDDIVKGLSREIEQKHETHAAPVAAPTHQEVMQAVYEAPTPAPEYVPAPVAAAPVYQAAPKQAVVPAMAPMNADVRDFVAALLNGDRDTVFGMIRSMARQGQDTETFVSHAACALDDAYRACIDGTTCHPDIAELTNGCHPSYLERLVSSLTTAVDGSYSAGMTGVKMALTRALGVVAG